MILLGVYVIAHNQECGYVSSVGVVLVLMGTSGMDFFVEWINEIIIGIFAATLVPILLLNF